jgi:hypothetical protein
MRILFVLLGFCCFSPLVSQNLYDLNASKSFAKYLIKTQQFSLAALELERLVYLEPNNDSLKKDLIKSYSYTKAYDLALNRLNRFEDNPINLDSTLAELYIYNLMASKKFDAAYNFLNNPIRVSNNKKQYYLGFSYLLIPEFKKAGKYILENAPKNDLLKPLKLLSDEANHAKRKSPPLAAIMSTVIPGTGKIYTGDWKDAIISMITIGFSGYQAYRGFKIKGTEKPMGWIFGSIATGFYLGNIYGSNKSAKRYNKRELKKVNQKIEDAFFITP